MSDDRFIDSLVQERRDSFWTSNRLLVAAVVAALCVAAFCSYLFLGASSEAPSGSSVQPIFLLKIAFVLSIVFSALSIVRDLSSPGRRIGLPLLLIVAPFIVVGALSVNELLSGHAQTFVHSTLHASITTCLWQIGLLALPAFAVLVVIVRTLAPVHLARTGLYIGLLSGAIGAFGYAFHCHESFVSIVAISYSLAIAQMGLLGSLLGPRLLRWS